MTTPNSQNQPFGSEASFRVRLRLNVVSFFIREHMHLAHVQVFALILYHLNKSGCGVLWTGCA
ncbi:MAG: hypothetical protein AB1649_30175, partial [Chloroflexota bacterium]